MRALAEAGQDAAGPPATAAAAPPEAQTSAAVDLTAGTSAGIAQLLVGHPFDSVKVKMQTAAAGQQGGAIHATRQILAAGPLQLYKGMGAPLATVAAFNAVLFSTWGAVERFFVPEGGPMSVSQSFMAGCIAGIPVSFLATPTELLKCRLQKQAGRKPLPGQVFTAADYRAGNVLFKGPVDVLVNAMKYEGPFSVMRGLSSTLLREVPGNGFYFAAYELCKKTFAAAQGLPSTAELGPISLMTAGGIGGAAFWVAMYPVDVVKTKLQTQNPFQPQYSGIMDCTRKLLAQHGWRSLYVGFTPCILRSIPANAVAFVTFEGVRGALT